MPARTDDTARVLTWNLERKRHDSELGALGVERLFGHEPDVMALTEVRTSFPVGTGHGLWCEPPTGDWFAENERKVMIWSSQPWRDVDRVGIDGLDQTRFVSATTDTPIGPLRVLGVCIPWHMAEVQYPIDIKRRPWELHVRFLERLAELLASSDVPTIVAGDFNQHVPRIKYGNKQAAAALTETFQSFEIATQGQLDGCSRPGIDHVAISPHLQAAAIWGWSHMSEGRRLSDHDGAAVDLASRS